MGKAQIGFVDRQKPLKGILRCRVYRHVNGEKRLIEDIEENNLIVNIARDQMARLVAGEFGKRNITKIGFGTDETKPELTDAGLTGAYVKSLDGFEYPETGRVQFAWSLGENEANGKAIREFGLFCDDGKLFARRRREKVGGDPADPIFKESDISLGGTWTIIF
jgi:hypothetical protein